LPGRRARPSKGHGGSAAGNSQRFIVEVFGG
jgi:hypothetical protein